MVGREDGKSKQTNLQIDSIFQELFIKKWQVVSFLLLLRLSLSYSILTPVHAVKLERVRG